MTEIKNINISTTFPISEGFHINTAFKYKFDDNCLPLYLAKRILVTESQTLFSVQLDIIPQAEGRGVVMGKETLAWIVVSCTKPESPVHPMSYPLRLAHGGVE